MRLVGLALLVAASVVGMWALDSGSAAAQSCSDQNGVCVSACMTYGIGHGRKNDPHPMPADFCRHHCAAWYNGCLKTGCWNGDLAKACGLNKG